MKDKLVILLDKPLKDEAEDVFLNELLDQADVPRSTDVIISNINVVTDCVDLNTAKVIVAHGNKALDFLLGISSIRTNRGKKLYTDKYDCTIIPTLSIGDTIKSKKLVVDKRYILSDLRTAKGLFIQEKKEIHNYMCVDLNDKEAFDRLMKKLKTLDLFSFDIEAHEEPSWNVQKAKLLGVGFSWKVGTGVYVVMQDQHKVTDKAIFDYRINELRNVLENNAEKIAHNCSYELLRLAAIPGIDINIKNLIWDTILMHHLYDENSRHGLDNLSGEYAPDLDSYKDESTVFVPKQGGSFTKVPTPILARRCAADCDLTLRLFLYLKDKLKEQNLLPLYNQIVMPHRFTLTGGEKRGVKIDRKELERIDPIIKSRKDEAFKNLVELLGKPDFNPGSGQQVLKVMEEQVPKSLLDTLERASKDSPNPSTNEDNMLILADHGYKFPSLLIKYRQLAKLYSTYIEGTLKRLTDEDTLHTSYKVFGTVTGRLSSSNPNLQNIPTNAKLLDEYKLPSDISIRKLFVPRDGYKFIVSDGSQMELRLLAVMSQDPLLIKTFKEGGDIHTLTGLEIIPGARDIQKEYNAAIEIDQEKKLKHTLELEAKWSGIRRVAKEVNFGIAYGRGAKALGESLKISRMEAQHFLDAFMEKYIGVYSWIQQTKGFAKVNGYVLNLFGRRRRLLDINSPVQCKKNEAERQAINSPIQGSAAECTAIVNIRIDREIKKRGLDAHFVLNIHDELVHEVHEDIAEEVKEIVTNCWLEPIPRVNVPLDISVEVGHQWEH